MNARKLPVNLSENYFFLRSKNIHDKIGYAELKGHGIFTFAESKKEKQLQLTVQVEIKEYYSNRFFQGYIGAVNHRARSKQSPSKKLVDSLQGVGDVLARS